MNKPYYSSISQAKAVTSSGLISSFLSNLAFINHGLRLGLLFSSLVVFHSLILTLFPWEMLQVNEAWQGMYAWFLACSLIAMLDRFFLSRSVFDYRHSFLLTLQGEFDQAIIMLDRISPETNDKLVCCPPLLFNLHRIFICIHAGALVEAEYRLELAKEMGLNKDRYHALQLQICTKRGDLESIAAIYQLAEEQHFSTALFNLEYGFSLLKQREDWRLIKAAFIKTMSKTKQIHSCGLDTTTIAQAFVAVSNLWTGKAEEGLEDLNFSLANLSAELSGNESIRLISSTLLLERALYFATHQEPEAALKDLNVAIKQCSLEQQKVLADKVIDELSWRHPHFSDKAIIL